MKVLFGVFKYMHLNKSIAKITLTKNLYSVFFGNSCFVAEHPSAVSLGYCSL